MLVLGPDFESHLHSHHAVQLAIGLEGDLRMRSTSTQPWSASSAFLVPPNVPHEFDAQGSTCALFYLFPGGKAYTGLQKLHGGSAIEALSVSPEIMQTLRKISASDSREQALADQVCSLLFESPATATQTPQDPRFEAVLGWINRHLDQPIKLAELASAVGISESWISHRFRQYEGVTLRRYVLCNRLRNALHEALKGYSLTDAAHRAGFSDSAHFTRTFRDAYGICPSFVLSRSEPCQVFWLNDESHSTNG
ncbi:HTH araC/xylS-type domain-containing protein [Pseudomonas marincola]|uniref:HTH araC/xylS-type domain-containing protein n=1 Tax=Pseudomonas marincola TaxID=437900 RepID=A0A653E6R3_9PSED|nr:AraC family transcriptional regulator [Pseudomonas marincola]CAE6897875.1 HTH araC/xylS-type domain-containing protein [Pseudomonas marincola]